MENEKSKKFFSAKTTRSVVIIAAVLLIGLAVYLNYRWFYDPVQSLGYGDNNMDNNVDGSQSAGTETDGEEENNYFTSTALTRKMSRDEAIEVFQNLKSPKEFNVSVIGKLKR